MAYLRPVSKSPPNWISKFDPSSLPLTLNLPLEMPASAARSAKAVVMDALVTSSFPIVVANEIVGFGAVKSREGSGTKVRRG